MTSRKPSGMTRRQALFSIGTAAAATGLASTGRAAELHGVPHETAMSADHLPVPAHRGGSFRVITDQTDRNTLKAVFDRLIPADDRGPSASEAGCLEFLDDQLSRPYGDGAALYLDGPMNREREAKMLGAAQVFSTPRERYKAGLPALEAYARKTHGTSFGALSPDQIDEILTGLEAGQIDLGDGVDGQAFFELMLQNAREGYLADPLYGGNRDMAGWKMIGFPGARYDYRPYIDRRGEDLNLTPVSLIPND